MVTSVSRRPKGRRFGGRNGNEVHRRNWIFVAIRSFLGAILIYAMMLNINVDSMQACFII